MSEEGASHTFWFSGIISALQDWNFLLEESTNLARLALKPGAETAFETCVTLTHAHELFTQSSLWTQAIKTSTCINKICLVRAVYSGYSLLPGYYALVLLTFLVIKARACNSWETKPQLERVH